MHALEIARLVLAEAHRLGLPADNIELMDQLIDAVLRYHGL